MKILYISRGDHVDYQDDCLSIGLKELFGSDVVDINKRYHIYNSYNADEVTKLYGMGMTVTRVLEDYEVDRTEIGKKIRSKYFDLIVYGSIWRCSDYLEDILKYYPVERIAVVDGEDEQNIHQSYKYGVNYFKRELTSNSPKLFPISFAIPTYKLNFDNTKTREIAICDPRDRSTYIYDNETDYYMGYRHSKFAYTIKKSGWDCMRHYEILANGCIPLFLNIQNCPHQTMAQFPKDLCSEVAQLYYSEKAPDEIYNIYGPIFQSITTNRLTTKALADYFIKILKP